ncbi:MAG: L,D-transpeptidase [Deltaproteobacteria bacterium]|nr:L,D-transpeptidase [Deltaproteobacteria bacterium]
MLFSTTIAVTCAACNLTETLGERVEAVLEAPRDLGPPQRVFAKRFVAPIRSTPDPEAPRLGYLRAGALLHSTTSLPVAEEGCEGGWYELDTGGFVCAGGDVTIFSGEKLPERRARQPDREAVMPYEFVTVRKRTPVYRRLPSVDEIFEVPSEQADAGVEESLEIDNPLVVRVLEPGFHVSLDRTFERDGRTYWRTQQNGFVPDQPLRRRPWSEFRGRLLGGRDGSLPVAVTRGGETTVYRVNDRGRIRTTRDRLNPRTWLPIRSRQQLGDDVYLAVRDDRLVREADVRFIQPTAPPPEVADGERWIDIDLERQVLVAYDWLQPRYVTLISSGRRKGPRPELDYRTPRGAFRIRAKHLTATMDNDEPGEPPYSLEDVPYVMYFRGAYAFHTAFWHDRFGRPRSHGCINMAPEDAKWLYNWAGPDVPPSWHGGYATDENPGTWVFIHGETP